MNRQNGQFRDTIYKYCLEQIFGVIYAIERTYERRVNYERNSAFPQKVLVGCCFKLDIRQKEELNTRHENVMDYWFRTDPEDFIITNRSEIAANEIFIIRI